MTDTEILNKVYEFLQKRQEFWDNCTAKCFEENKLGTLQHQQAMFQGASITEVIWFIDDLRSK